MIQPGLERISRLLRNVEFPWKSIHVAGTNGKGTICYYASTLLTKRKLRCGTFTSPHLVDRWDSISIDNKTVDKALFQKIEKHYIELSLRAGIGASPFEILTATAFHIFTEEKVQFGVVEAGMGGKLDATNILNNQAVSVISKIARDHENFLGTTLNQIALHKAGILRPNVPYLVNPHNEHYVTAVIRNYAKEIGAGPALSYDPPDLTKAFFSKPEWHRFTNKLRSSQIVNPKMAVLAVTTALESRGLQFKPRDIGTIMYLSKLHEIPGRLELIKVPPVFGDTSSMAAGAKKGPSILVDGAHNPDAASMLNDYVSQRQRKRIMKDKNKGKPDRVPVTWVLAMSEGKDAREFLTRLLQPQDNVITTTFGPVDGMPWVHAMDPKELLAIAKSVQPTIMGLAMPYEGVLRALCAARYLTEEHMPIVLTGSLYLVGDFHREFRPRRIRDYWTNPAFKDDRKMFAEILVEEKHRVNQLLSGHDIEPFAQENSEWNKKSDEKRAEREKQAASRKKRRAIQEEILALDQDLERLAEEERGIAQTGSPAASAHQALEEGPISQSGSPSDSGHSSDKSESPTSTTSSPALSSTSPDAVSQTTEPRKD
ncbi:Mur ligase [Decorospora gaudefroyi]|uniref:Mur ligase n=1 Tax=Decorospora gaudefroyi TaxID=184978 RepID=A0A6A5KV90_9PLEO|nr:Mur ligase [Decorospora gaudefroyi]